MSFRAYLPAAEHSFAPKSGVVATHALESSTMQSEIMSVAEAAAYLGLSKHLLNKWRLPDRAGEGPDWIKLGKRRVGYRLADLVAWVERNRKGPTR